MSTDATEKRFLSPFKGFGLGGWGKTTPATPDATPAGGDEVALSSSGAATGRSPPDAVSFKLGFKGFNLSGAPPSAAPGGTLNSSLADQLGNKLGDGGGTNWHNTAFEITASDDSGTATKGGFGGGGGGALGRSAGDGTIVLGSGGGVGSGGDGGGDGHSVLPIGPTDSAMTHNMVSSMAKWHMDTTHNITTATRGPATLQSHDAATAKDGGGGNSDDDGAHGSLDSYSSGEDIPGLSPMRRAVVKTTGAGGAAPRMKPSMALAGGRMAAALSAARRKDVANAHTEHLANGGAGGGKGGVNSGGGMESEDSDGGGRKAAADAASHEDPGDVAARLKNALNGAKMLDAEEDEVEIDKTGGNAFIARKKTVKWIPFKDKAAKPKKSALARSASQSGVHFDPEVKVQEVGASKAPLPPTPPESIKLPNLSTTTWDELVHSVVWRVGRVFGFQAFNCSMDPKLNGVKEWVPGSIFVATDHLVHMLNKNFFLRRDKAEEKVDDERFAKAVYELHGHIFLSYESLWARKMRLPTRPRYAWNVLDEHAFSDPNCINGMLCELALYFLIYSESANLKFCPELLWFLYWCMNFSDIMRELWLGTKPYRVPNGRHRRQQLRNEFALDITDIQDTLNLHPARMRPEDCGRLTVIHNRLDKTRVPHDDRVLVADLIAYGDGGFYLDRIVTPIFYVMSYEIDHLSNLNVEVAFRLGYDDFNESLCHHDIVHQTLNKLRTSDEHIRSARINDAYLSLTNMGFQHEERVDATFDPQDAAEFWRTQVFVKTYRERRTWWGPYRAFYRVYASHIILYYVMQVYAFVGNDLNVMASVTIVHAGLTFLERFAHWFMTRNPKEPTQTALDKVFDSKSKFKTTHQKHHAKQLGRSATMASSIVSIITPKKKMQEAAASQTSRVIELEGSSWYHWTGMILWLVIMLASLAFFLGQYFSWMPWQQASVDWWAVYAGSYIVLFLLHYMLGTRDGYQISITEMLGLPRWVRFLSRRHEPVSWLYVDMAMKWKTWAWNILFWIVILCMKVPFDYFVIVKPAVEPIRVLLDNRHWLACANAHYYVMGEDSQLPCIGGDWLLVFARLFPFVIVVMFDTSLFYQVTVTTFGIFRGLAKLDLGVVASWEDLVREFHRSPARWWGRVMSEVGCENQKLLFKQQMYAAAMATRSDGIKGGAVSDGKMFKVKMVTPEDILRGKEKKKNVNITAGRTGAAEQAGQLQHRAGQQQQQQPRDGDSITDNSSVGGPAGHHAGWTGSVNKLLGTKAAPGGAQQAEGAGTPDSTAGSGSAAAGGGSHLPGWSRTVNMLMGTNSPLVKAAAARSGAATTAGSGGGGAPATGTAATKQVDVAALSVMQPLGPRRARATAVISLGSADANHHQQQQQQRQVAGKPPSSAAVPAAVNANAAKSGGGKWGKLFGMVKGAGTPTGLHSPTSTTPMLAAASSGSPGDSGPSSPAGGAATTPGRRQPRDMILDALMRSAAEGTDAPPSPTAAVLPSTNVDSSAAAAATSGGGNAGAPGWQPRLASWLIPPELTGDDMLVMDADDGDAVGDADELPRGRVRTSFLPTSFSPPQPPSAPPPAPPAPQDNIQITSRSSPDHHEITLGGPLAEATEIHPWRRPAGPVAEAGGMGVLKGGGGGGGRDEGREGSSVVLISAQQGTSDRESPLDGDGHDSGGDTASRGRSGAGVGYGGSNDADGDAEEGDGRTRASRMRRAPTFAAAEGKLKRALTHAPTKKDLKAVQDEGSQATHIIKKDAPTSTMSMFLVEDALQTLEDDEADEVHEQMMMWNAFAIAWDEVIDDLRESDLLDDRETGLLKFMRLDVGGNLYGLRPILLPTFFYAGQIRKVIDTGSTTTAQIMVLNEMRVLMVWLCCQIGILSGKHAHVLMSVSFYTFTINVKHLMMRKATYDAGIKFIALLEDICDRGEVPFDIKEHQDAVYTILKGLETECLAVLKAKELGRMGQEELDVADDLLEIVAELKHEMKKDPLAMKGHLRTCLSDNTNEGDTNSIALLRVIRQLKLMLTTTEAEATPTSEEAQRILGFFVNSLSHPSLDRPPSLDKMWSWSVLTPAYEEDVLYALQSEQASREMGMKPQVFTDLMSETADTVSIMGYLRATFPEEWTAFAERMKRKVGGVIPAEIFDDLTEFDFAPGHAMYAHRTELQMWASFRGQLLSRTVRGMMQYERALRTLARIEYPMPDNVSEEDYQSWVSEMVRNKFEYVVAVQTYGRNKTSNSANLRWLARSVDILMQKWPSIKVAYLDTFALDDVPTQYSVLMRGRRANDVQVAACHCTGDTMEAYRIRLPLNRYSSRGVVIGEGKPENQNHAVVFAFGEGLQTIDMNMDNNLAEALKMRNLLGELNPSTKGIFHSFVGDEPECNITGSGISGAHLRDIVFDRMSGITLTALVGFREWIFSDKTGALGRYAAATEYAFATIQSRTMTHPGRVRMHYGHPDVFNKLFTMTRGGVSKGTRQLHISEDYFIGVAHTLRGGRIRYKEYISCGKGRDMGFDSILSYQKKIAGGAGELAISREMYRVGTRLEFFRLMHFYHCGIGHYLNQFLTMCAVTWNVFVLLLYALSGSTEISVIGPNGQPTLVVTYNVQQVLQLGTLSIIPYLGQLILEAGVVKAVTTVGHQIISGSLCFYMFQQQTVSEAFRNDINYGAAKYHATGRGFAVSTMDFIKVYTSYGRTHLYCGFEILFMMIVLMFVRDCQSCNWAALTWNSWFLGFVLVLAPMWFNPFIFDMFKVARDFAQWRRWINGDLDIGTHSNWYTWNREELTQMRNDLGNQTDNWMNVLSHLSYSAFPNVLLAVATVSKFNLQIAGLPVKYSVFANSYIIFFMATIVIWVAFIFTVFLQGRYRDRVKQKEWRMYRWGLTALLIIIVVFYLTLLARWYDNSGFGNMCLLMYANINILMVIHRAGSVMFTQNAYVRGFVDAGFYFTDQVLGFLYFFTLGILTFIGIVGILQSKLLFNDTFAMQVANNKVGKALRRRRSLSDYSMLHDASAPPPAPPPPGNGSSTLTAAGMPVRKGWQNTADTSGSGDAVLVLGQPVEPTTIAAAAPAQHRLSVSGSPGDGGYPSYGGAQRSSMGYVSLSDVQPEDTEGSFASRDASATGGSRHGATAAGAAAAAPRPRPSPMMGSGGRVVVAQAAPVVDTSETRPLGAPQQYSSSSSGTTGNLRDMDSPLGRQQQYFVPPGMPGSTLGADDSGGRDGGTAPPAGRFGGGGLGSGHPMFSGPAPVMQDAQAMFGSVDGGGGGSGLSRGRRSSMSGGVGGNLSPGSPRSPAATSRSSFSGLTPTGGGGVAMASQERPSASGEASRMRRSSLAS